MPKNFDAIIFDFDGTLYDNYKIGKNLISSNFFDLPKIGADRKIRKELKGKFFGNEQAFFSEYYKLLSAKTHMSLEKAEQWYQGKYMPAMIKILTKKYTCQPGIPELFKYLDDNGIKSAVFSDYNLVYERMASVDIDPSVCKNLYSSVELGGLKPAAEPFLFIAKELGVEPARVLVVGDRDDTDGQGARNCGMQYVQLKIQGTKTKAEDVDHPLLSWNELCDFIKKD